MTPYVEDLRAALAHHQAGQLDRAEAFYRAALADPACDPNVRPLVGLFLIERGDAEQASGRAEQACQLYRDALDASPTLAEGWFKLGDALSRLGGVDEAIAALRRAVELDPGLTAAHRALAAAGQSVSLDHLSELLERPDLPPADKVNVHFGSATLLERLGRYDEAFRHLDEGNAILRQSLSEAGHVFDAQALHAYVDERIATCTPQFFAHWSGCGNASDLPVFVVGMPRSGTTLVEQILSSHKLVHGIGEGQRIGAVSADIDATARSKDYGDWDREACRFAADRYIERLSILGEGAMRVVDKTPDDLFHLALIAVLFPHARVIMCRRDPRDICLSCYFQTFAELVPYANDLAACAVRVLETGRLMDHWLAVLPLPILTVDYEAIVADPETESRRMIGFLGLDWEPACLEFHKSRRPVQSASLWQVRTPLYGSSAGRWRHYRPHLEPLLTVFGRD